MPEVRLLAGLREALGRGEKRTRVEGRTVGQLLERLIEQSGNALAARRVVFEEDGSGELTRDIRVLVNGRNVRFLAGLETPIDESDSVTLHRTGVRGYPGG